MIEGYIQGFDIKKFAEEFKSTIDWMLSGKYAENITKYLQDFKTDKNSLKINPESSDALYEIIKLIATKGDRLKRNNEFKKRLSNFIDSYGANFRSEDARKKMIELVGEKATKNVDILLEYKTIKEFTESLYNSAKKGEPPFVLGEKGRDEYLRDFGYWDRIPIDRHEMRFIIRSGIYHACSVDSENDPLEKSSLHEALTRFSSVYLKGKVIEGIELDNAPGIVDIFIWSFCAAYNAYNICGSTPKCNECNLNKVCLYALTNSA